MKFHRILSIIGLFMVLLFISTPGASVLAAPDPRGWMFPAAAFAVVKTPDAQAVNAIDKIGFSITVTNTTQNLAYNVALVDQLDKSLSWTVDNPGCSVDSNGLMTCTLGYLAGGASTKIHYTASGQVTMCGTLTNIAEVTATNALKVYSNTAEVNVQCTPDMTVTKEAQPAQINNGQTARYVITVRNAGRVTATEASLTDTLPGGHGLTWTIDPPVQGCNITGQLLECAFDSLAGGASRVVTVTSPTSVASCGVITNTASVAASNEPPDKQGNNSANADLTVGGPGCNGNAPILTVTKAADPGPSPIPLNGQVGFTITVHNDGQGTATGVIIDDDLNPNLTWRETTGADCTFTAGHLTCNMGDLIGGADAIVHVVATVNQAACGVMKNTAFAEASNHGQVQSNEVSVTIISDFCLVDLVNVKLEKTAEKNPVFQNESIVFKMVVTNNSTMSANGVVLTDALPHDVAGLTWSIVAPVPQGCSIDPANTQLTCDFGTLTSGSTRTVSITSPGNELVGSGDINIVNTGTVSAKNEDPNHLGDNTATASTVVKSDCFNTSAFGLYYLNDYESSTPGKLGVTNYKHDVTPKGQGFLGQYGNDTVSIKASCLPPGTTDVLVSFDLYVIRSWDGNGPLYGPDVFTVDVDGKQVLLNTTFTNRDKIMQSYPDPLTDPMVSHPAWTGSVAINTLGFMFPAAVPVPMDSIYHFKYIFPHTGDTLTINLTGSGLEPMWNESWGIDNFWVSKSPNVPYYLPIVPTQPEK